MFCAKLKELKIPGECPFSSSAQNNELGDFEERSTGAADLLPISKDVHGKIGGDLPQQKTVRAKVNLHTLGESIRKLACPEVSYIIFMNIHIMQLQYVSHRFIYEEKNILTAVVFVACLPYRTDIMTVY